MKMSTAPVYLQEVDGWISLTANDPGHNTTLHYVYGTLTEVAINRFKTGYTSPTTGHVSEANT